MTEMLMFWVLDRRIIDYDVLFLFLEFLDVDVFVMQIVFIVGQLVIWRLSYSHDVICIYIMSMLMTVLVIMLMIVMMIVIMIMIMLMLIDMSLNS